MPAALVKGTGICCAVTVRQREQIPHPLRCRSGVRDGTTIGASIFENVLRVERCYQCFRLQRLKPIFSHEDFPPYRPTPPQDDRLNVIQGPWNSRPWTLALWQHNHTLWIANQR